MSNINLSDIFPKLLELIHNLYINIEKGTQIASQKNYHIPTISNYLHIINNFSDMLIPNDVSLCNITGRVHLKWYYSTYYILVESIPEGNMYNVSIVSNGLAQLPIGNNTTVTLNDLCIILLLHTLNNKISISSLSEKVDELDKIRNIVRKTPLIKASSLPRP